MIFAEVASRVGLLGKVNLPREPGERARVERRKRKGAEMGRLYRATARKSPTKLRRCLSRFALRSLGEMHRGVGEHRRRVAVSVLSSRFSGNIGLIARPGRRRRAFETRTPESVARLGKFADANAAQTRRTRGKAGWKPGVYDVRRSFLGELVLYLTTHQRRVNAHLPTGVVCRQRKQACGKKWLKPLFPSVNAGCSYESVTG